MATTALADLKVGRRDNGIFVDKKATATAVSKTPSGAKDPPFDRHRVWPNLLA